VLEESFLGDFLKKTGLESRLLGAK
jgi:hypothetical protein